MTTEVDDLTTNPYNDSEFDSAYREEAEQFLEEFGMDATHGQLRAWVEAHSKALQQ
jgi:hypothetical protein